MTDKTLPSLNRQILQMHAWISFQSIEIDHTRSYLNIFGLSCHEVSRLQPLDRIPFTQERYFDFVNFLMSYSCFAFDFLFIYFVSY